MVAAVIFWPTEPLRIFYFLENRPNLSWRTSVLRAIAYSPAVAESMALPGIETVRHWKAPQSARPVRPDKKNGKPTCCNICRAYVGEAMDFGRTPGYC